MKKNIIRHEKKTTFVIEKKNLYSTFIKYIRKGQTVNGNYIKS